MPAFVPSGGQSPDEPCPKSEFMATYLVKSGIERQDIVQEDRSTNTRESFAFSADMMHGDWMSKGEPRVASSTTNYHVFGRCMYAHQAGMDDEVIATPTRGYLWPNAFLREFVGLIVAQWPQIIMGLLAVVMLYGTMEHLMLLEKGDAHGRCDFKAIPASMALSGDKPACRQIVRRGIGDPTAFLSDLFDSSGAALA